MEVRVNVEMGGGYSCPTVVLLLPQTYLINNKFR